MLSLEKRRVWEHFLAASQYLTGLIGKVGIEFLSRPVVIGQGVCGFKLKADRFKLSIREKCLLWFKDGLVLEHIAQRERGTLSLEVFKVTLGGALGSLI